MRLTAALSGCVALLSGLLAIYLLCSGIWAALASLCGEEYANRGRIRALEVFKGFFGRIVEMSVEAGPVWGER